MEINQNLFLMKYNINDKSLEYHKVNILVACEKSASASHVYG